MRRERDEQKITYVTERVGKGFVIEGIVGNKGGSNRSKGTRIK